MEKEKGLEKKKNTKQDELVEKVDEQLMSYKDDKESRLEFIDTLLLTFYDKGCEDTIALVDEILEAL